VRNVGNAQLLWSQDRGKTWQWGFKMEAGFGSPAFLNFGRNYAGARDSYVYVYSQDGPSAYESDNALTLAILGVSDIDRFTLGDCQDSTVRTLLEKAPDLHLKNSPAAAAKAKGCAGIAKLLGVRYP